MRKNALGAEFALVYVLLMWLKFWIRVFEYLKDAQTAAYVRKFVR